MVLVNLLLNQFTNPCNTYMYVYVLSNWKVKTCKCDVSISTFHRMTLLNGLLTL